MNVTDSGPASSERALRTRLFLELRMAGVAASGAVARALLSVPRHEFLPGEPAEAVYRDQLVVTKTVAGIPTSSSSRPGTMVTMLQQLRVESGQRVLEIGTGTGYNAALLAYLAGPAGRVTTVEIDPELIERAQHRLRTAGYAGVTVVGADGRLGYQAGAPYDRIIATAACWQIPQLWIDQLAEGGTLVVPFRLNGAQVCLTLDKIGGELRCRHVFPCGFIPLTGPSDPLRSPQPVAPNLLIGADVEVDEPVRRALAGLLTERHTTTLATVEAIDQPDALFGYVLLQGLPMFQVYLRQDTGPSYRFLAFVAQHGSAVGLPIWPWGWPQPGQAVPTCGNRQAIVRIEDAVDSWNATGRPDFSMLRGRIYPAVDNPGPVPRPIDGLFGFRRGAHRYDFWFEPR